MELTLRLISLFGAVYTILSLIFAGQSFDEQEIRAGRIARNAAVLFWFITITAYIFKGLLAQIILASFILFTVVLASLFFIPIRGKKETSQQRNHRYDEREIMFARMRMETDSPQFEQYYTDHPEHREIDAEIRAGSWKSRKTLQSQLMEIASDASFEAIGALRDSVDGPTAEQIKEIPFEKRNSFIAGLAKHFGALDVGITALKPEHVYSHIGRGAGIWGEEIHLEHTFAIALTAEMKQEHVATAPRQPIMAESAVQYANIGLTAVMLANAIRGMGYEARAHIDGNYRVICPLVARDAGLGEIGRMGLLMTPKQGPRVRIAVVTTTMPLQAYHYEPIEGMLDFCERCKKCADNCPGKAIPTNERTLIDGALRWQIDQQKCYQFWTKVGTDCGRCMAVCPLSHSNHWMHSLIRQAITRSAVFRRVYVPIDRWLYGRHPKPKQPPKWQTFSEEG